MFAIALVTRLALRTPGKQYTPNCLDTPITTAPAEASSRCGGRPVAGKEEVAVIVSICVWIAFTRIRRLSKHYRAPQAIEDEPSPPPLCGQAPKTETGLFVQC